MDAVCFQVTHDLLFLRFDTDVVEAVSLIPAKFHGALLEVGLLLFVVFSLLLHLEFALPLLGLSSAQLALRCFLSDVGFVTWFAELRLLVSLKDLFPARI